MPEQRSAIEEAYEVGPFGAENPAAAITLRERRARSLVQVSGWPGDFDPICKKLQEILEIPMPADGLRAASGGPRSIFRVGPERLWLTGPADDRVLGAINEAGLGDASVVTEISHSRTVLRLCGSHAATVLNRGLPVDLDDTAFPPGAFAQSVIHHIPVLIHRLEGESERTFDIYVSRDFAVTLWQWLIEAIEPFGGQVLEAQICEAE